MRIALLSAGVVGALAAAGSALDAAPAVRPAASASAVARPAGSGSFRPASLPAGYQVISRDTGARWSGGGTFESTTYGTMTKREALATHRTGLGAIFTVTVFRGGAAVTPPAGAVPRAVRGQAGWTLDSPGSVILGWTEREGISVQVIGQHGFSPTRLADIATHLVERP